jgi:ankyrin repeat protein
MTSYFKFLIYLIVFIGYSSIHAGSYDDFFTAIKRDDDRVIVKLLSRGFDPNTPNPDGDHGLLLAIREPSLKVVAALLGAKNIQVEPRNRQDESPLMLASLKGLTDVARRLVAQGADVNKPGWTPLHYAATSGNLEIIRLLLDNHAYIDASSPNASTPLMMAAMYGTASAAKLLLESGADPTIKNDQGLTALDFAQRANRADAFAIISAFTRAREPRGQW